MPAKRTAPTLACALACAFACALACAQTTSFTCADSSDCTDGSFNGVCQPNGYCSFGDDTCPSGQRYGDLAPGELAGNCVELDATTGEPSTTDGGDSTTLTTLEGPTLEESTSGGSSLDGTTTTGAESSSTGNSVHEESSTGPGSMTSVDTNDSSDTMVPECQDVPAMDPCSMCAYAACCTELTNCSTEKSCVCMWECKSSADEDICEMECGPSETYDAFYLCLVVNCPMECVFMP